MALWTHDLERLRAFYERYFAAQVGPLYKSATRPGFTSYFLTFPGGSGRVELMSGPEVGAESRAPVLGYAHVAMGVGSRPAMDALVDRLRADGVRLLSGPRVTGDGYYEAVIEDPDGNVLEITA